MMLKVAGSISVLAQGLPHHCHRTHASNGLQTAPRERSHTPPSRRCWQRVQALKDQGIEDSSLKGRDRNEEDLFRVVEVLRISLRHHAGMQIDQMCPQEEHIESVMHEMGLAGVDMSPPQTPVTINV